MIACCISGYVFVYRFKIDLAGATCAFEKLYWDMKEGQLREEYPKWDGLDSIGEKLNILSKLTDVSLKRVDVNFLIQEKNFDTFIGRTAHIQFLENTDFMKILFYNIEDLFK
jgi:hypothetical protein